MLTLANLERWQVVVYALAIATGAGLGGALPSAGAWLGNTVWPLLAVLLFVTFLQVPLTALGAVVQHRRYLAALLAGNFVAVPLLVWGLSQLVPDDPSMRLGFFLVLLLPCTDWFTTFTHLGRGDSRLALASTPILLLAQMALLPGFLWLFLGPEATAGMRAGPFLQAFVGIILLPLALAFWIERAAKGRRRFTSMLEKSAWLPIPLLALVLLVITASEVRGVVGAAGDLPRIVALFVLYLGLAPIVALSICRALRISAPPTRTVVFSMATRNSFVVLPLVLAWPGAGAIAASVVVIQSLVELCGMLVYIAVVPRWGRAGTGDDDAPCKQDGLE